MRPGSRQAYIRAGGPVHDDADMSESLAKIVQQVTRGTQMGDRAARALRIESMLNPVQALGRRHDQR